MAGHETQQPILLVAHVCIMMSATCLINQHTIMQSLAVIRNDSPVNTHADEQQS